MDAPVDLVVHTEPASEEVCATFCPTERPAAAGECPSLDGLAEKTRSGCLAPLAFPNSVAVARATDLDQFLFLAHRNRERSVRTFSVKFMMDVERGHTHLMNTSCYVNHVSFTRAIGCAEKNTFQWVRGTIYYSPSVDGAGVFSFDVARSALAPDVLASVHRALSDALPFVDVLAYAPRTREESARLRRAPFELATSVESGSFQLHSPGRAFGVLRRVDYGEIPTSDTIAIYSTVPAMLPTLAGVLSTSNQVPLSHANVRAMQMGIPNAFVARTSSFDALVGEHVAYEASEHGYSISRANSELVDAYRLAVEHRRGPTTQPDVSGRAIRELSDVRFSDHTHVGRKAANVAELMSLGVSGIPHGAAIPFGFYDEFMRHNGLDEDVDDVVDEASRDAFQERIRAATMPSWMMDALSEAHARFEGNVRCRSSASDEDGDQRSSAGLYGSYTHRPSEGHLSETVKKVYASAWSQRAFQHRVLTGVSHRSVAMGVLLHPSFVDESAHGVAVSHDPLFGFESEAYYVNVHAGERSLTRPRGTPRVEEVVVARGDDRFLLLGGAPGQAPAAVSPEHLLSLRDALTRVREHFRVLYGGGDDFAIEVEFKVTASGELAIKQARRWFVDVPTRPTWPSALCEARCQG